MKGTIRIGTRGSGLALAQTRWFADRVGQLRPDLAVEVHVVKTSGDRVQDRPLASVGVTGLFTKELDRALLEGQVDAAVHSLKDVPTMPVEGVLLAAVPAREDPRDVFIGKHGLRLAQLPVGAAVGTGSLRRRAQLLALRPDLHVQDMRGNIETRFRKLRDSESLHGIILALAGVRRLGLEENVTETLEIPDWLPAPGQGALAIATRRDDQWARSIVEPLDHPTTRAEVTAERAVLRRLECGCRVPVGACARIEEGALVLDGLIADPTGEQVVRDCVQGNPEGAQALGEGLADNLLAKGGAVILAAVEAQS